jgi:hypothetical protein
MPRFATIGLLALSTTSMAQLLGCDDIGCPIRPGNSMQANCQLGNITANNIGIAQMNTSLSPEPLTWTLGLSTSDATDGTYLTTWRKDFYLGQPASVNLQSSTATGACAIFLEGVASSLKFHSDVVANNAGNDNGSCGDALTPACASALENLVSGIVKSDDAFSGALTCDSLAQKLSANTPAACTLHPNLWTNISSRGERGCTILAEAVT